MFLIYYTSNCTYEPPRIRPLVLYQEIVILVLGIIAFVTNILALIVLCRPHSATRIGSIRFNLGVLSSAEMLLNFFIIILTSNNIYGLKDTQYVSSMVYGTVVFWNMNAFVCARNWFVALISLSRCEVIFRPMESRTSRLFSTSKLRFYICVLYVLSYLASRTRVLMRYAIVCEVNDTTTIRIGTHSFSLTYDAYCFFAFQSGLPVSIVFLSTFFMTYILLCSKPVDGLVTSSHHRQNNQRKATRTILSLALVFIFMELPVLLIRVIQRFEDLGQLTEIVYFVCRVLVVVDSCCNVIIYILTSVRFRKEFFRLVVDTRHCFSRRSESSNGFLAAAELLNIRPNMAEQISSATEMHKHRAY